MRPKLQSTPPVAWRTPETSCPRRRSSIGDHGTRLKPRSAVDHGEAARGEVEPAAVGAGHGIAGGDFGPWQAGLRCQCRRSRAELTAAQRVEQSAGEDDPLPLPARQTVLGEAVDPRVQGRPDLIAKSARRRCRRLARHELPVQPGRAAGADLGSDVQVRARHQSHPALARLRMNFDDAAERRRVLERAEVREAEMMDLPVDPIDDGIGVTGKFVLQAFVDQASDDRCCGSRAVDDVVAERLAPPPARPGCGAWSG